MKTDNANRLETPENIYMYMPGFKALTENKNDLLKLKNLNGHRSLVFGLT